MQFPSESSENYPSQKPVDHPIWFLADTAQFPNNPGSTYPVVPDLQLFPITIFDIGTPTAFNSFTEVPGLEDDLIKSYV